MRGLGGFGGAVCDDAGERERHVQDAGAAERGVHGAFFHDGSQATLEQVAAFYARNGDFRADGNLGPGIGRIRLSPQEQTAVVAFLKALTDDRVQFPTGAV
jgi:cytochrome c peroxidase